MFFDWIYLIIKTKNNQSYSKHAMNPWKPTYWVPQKLYKFKNHRSIDSKQIH